jgi:hypothetical protein
MEFKKHTLSEELGLPIKLKKNFTHNKSQKVVVSDTQLTRLMSNIMEQDEIKKMNRDRMRMRALINDPNYKEGGLYDPKSNTSSTGTTGTTTGTTEIEESMDSFDFDTEDRRHQHFGDSKNHRNPIQTDDMEHLDEDSEGEETYDYASSEGHDDYRLKHYDMSGSHRRNLKRDMAYDEDHEYRHERGTHFRESRKLKTTTPITESEVKEISNYMKRMGATGKRYNPAPSVIKSPSKKKDELYEDINKTYRAIRKSIINERTSKLEIKDYQEVLNESQDEWRGHNPGVSAAAGIENIIDNIKRAYSYVRDSKTRKQIANTLAKLNNFMMYTGELVGSGQRQRAPRSYDQVANPIPYPDLDEPEELEDIDDNLENFDV